MKHLNVDLILYSKCQEMNGTTCICSIFLKFIFHCKKPTKKRTNQCLMASSNSSLSKDCESYKHSLHVKITKTIWYIVEILVNDWKIVKNIITSDANYKQLHFFMIVSFVHCKIFSKSDSEVSSYCRVLIKW